VPDFLCQPSAARGALLALLVPVSLCVAFPVPETPFNPPTCLCPYTPQAPVVDGTPDEPCWEIAPWTTDFVDIRGGQWPAPAHRTRARLLWDEEALYVAAELVEPGLWGTFTTHDAIIYHEHDFEVFLDPDGDTHDYYELEINALGTVWDLFLTRPYRDDGTALNGWELAGLRSAVALTGTLNRPEDVDQGWTVEMALPWAALREAAHRELPPRPGDAWRLNFSRVEWQLEVVDGAYTKQRDAQGKALPEENWVWAPQGLVAMHYPERWGLLRFTRPGVDAPASDWGPDELAVQDVLMQLYYVQRNRMEEGLPCAAPADPVVPAPGWSPPRVELLERRFVATCDHMDGRSMSVDETGRLRRSR